MSAPAIVTRAACRIADPRISGALGVARGEFNEARVLRALLSGPLPAWFLGARRATPREDRAGTDLVVDAWENITIKVQVKSSSRQATAFRARQRALGIDTFAVVIVKDHEDDAILGARALWAVCKEYDRATGERV